jgi:phosphoribosylglycinamide formyltransferase-1
MKNIVIFASGSGTNAENIMIHFQNSAFAKVVAVFCNNENAKVIEKTKKREVATEIFSKNELNEGMVLKKLEDYHPDLIVLAGFLLKFPIAIIAEFPNKIINIHPSLLPKYGGKGMYGLKVHQSVLENNEAETGITIHFVNEHYDEGEFILQKSINIEDCVSADEIAEKINEMEMECFPTAIEKLLKNQT